MDTTEEFEFTVRITEHAVSDRARVEKRLEHIFSRFARLNFLDAKVINNGAVVPFIDMDHDIGVVE